MGAGASASFELNSEQKSLVIRKLSTKYEALSSSGDNSGDAPTDDIELFKALREEYDLVTQGFGLNNEIVVSTVEVNGDNGNSVVETTEGADITKNNKNNKNDDNNIAVDAEEEEAEAAEGGDVFSGIEVTKVDDEIEYFDEDEEVVEQRVYRTSSHDMLNDAASELLNDQRIMSEFVQSLKDGNESPTKSSKFRERRLTYSVTHAPSNSSKKVISPTRNLSPAKSTAHPTKTSPAKLPVSSRNNPRRTTIYSSAEIGVRQRLKTPFPESVMGTFSCHGIEPSTNEEDEDGIHQKDNQDRGCVVHPFKKHEQQALFLVLDGHGAQGDAVSEFCMRQIVVSLENNSLIENDPEEALKDSFIKTNAALMVTPIDFMTSGTTCVAVYMNQTQCWIAHVGDSRAVIAYTASNNDNEVKAEAETQLKAKDLTKDHKPDAPSEMARIEEWGGHVSPAPEPGMSARVWLDPEFSMIGLAMSRSIGDYAVKSVGVIPEPEVNKFEIKTEDQFMILASDGVWEFIDSQEAVDLVASKIDLGAKLACEYLIHCAAERWMEEEGDYRDDITAIVLTFPLPGMTSTENTSKATESTE